jgi:hypothetical protein
VAVASISLLGGCRAQTFNFAHIRWYTICMLGAGHCDEMPYSCAVIFWRFCRVVMEQKSAVCVGIKALAKLT